MSTPEPAPLPSSRSQRSASPDRRGLVYGLGAYGLWGLIPIYFKAVATPPVELLSHRVVWALAMLLLVCLRQSLFGEVRAAFRSRRSLALLCGSTLLIAANWLVYIWAVVNGRIVEGSLGYFMTPLVNVLLGVVILKERLDRPVIAALLVAACGVLWLSFQAGRPPWISLSLAATFGLYGLLRKLVRVGAVAGLTVETALLFPLALAYLVSAERRGALVFLSGSLGHDLALVLAGPITAIPLLLFAGAARRLPLTSLGFLQYLAPTLQFLVATILYREPFTQAQATGFGLVWAAILIFAFHTLRRGAEEPVMEPE
jgi:chloramphenicol-sensitive protein RarD